VPCVKRKVCISVHLQDMRPPFVLLCLTGPGPKQSTALSAVTALRPPQTAVNERWTPDIRIDLPRCQLNLSLFFAEAIASRPGGSSVLPAVLCGSRLELLHPTSVVLRSSDTLYLLYQTNLAPIPLPLVFRVSLTGLWWTHTLALQL